MRKDRRFAARTRVPVDQSRKDIERALKRYEATGFGYSWERRSATRPAAGGGSSVIIVEEHAIIAFDMKGMRIQLDLIMPEAEREQRQRWRALLLVITAKLEAIESGLGTLQSEFLANVVMKNGMTVGQVILPQLSRVIEKGLLLPAHQTEPPAP